MVGERVFVVSFNVMGVYVVSVSFYGLSIVDVLVLGLGVGAYCSCPIILLLLSQF